MGAPRRCPRRREQECISCRIKQLSPGVVTCTGIKISRIQGAGVLGSLGCQYGGDGRVSQGLGPTAWANDMVRARRSFMLHMQAMKPMPASQQCKLLAAGGLSAPSATGLDSAAIFRLSTSMESQVRPL